MLVQAQVQVLVLVQLELVLDKLALVLVLVLDLQQVLLLSLQGLFLQLVALHMLVVVVGLQRLEVVELLEHIGHLLDCPILRIRYIFLLFIVICDDVIYFTWSYAKSAMALFVPFFYVDAFGPIQHGMYGMGLAVIGCIV